MRPLKEKERRKGERGRGAGVGGQRSGAGERSRGPRVDDGDRNRPGREVRTWTLHPE